MQPSERVAGSIYDLGYRTYDGARLGRHYAILSLFTYSLRSAFGLGRRTSSKIIPFALAALVFIPAAIQLGIAAVVSGEVEIIRHDSYYGYVQVILALFCAAVAPEMVSRDQRQSTLSLYFSRALNRTDYAMAKWGALCAAMLVLTLGPQLLLFAGRALAADSLSTFVTDNGTDIVPIVVSASLLSALFAGIGIAIASQTGRRAYGTISILVAFIVPFTVAGIVAQIGSRPIGAIGVLLSPQDVYRGLTLWIFSRSPGPDGTLGQVDLAGWVYFAATIAYIAVCGAIIFRRYERIAA